MEIQVLGQGYHSSLETTVGNKLIILFADKEFHSFTGITAFTSQAGIIGLSKHIEASKKHLKGITIVTGVDLKGTSKEALEALMSLKIKTFIFYQPSITIFHPKIYLFEGKEKSELIIGSSNLTSLGLFSNVEASLLISIDNKKEEDVKIINQLKNYFKGIFDNTDPNLQKITKEIILELAKSKIVPTELERKEIQDKEKQTEKEETENIITKIFPKRAIAKIPSEFRETKTTNQTNISKPVKRKMKETELGELVWTRKKLPSSSVQGGEGETNPTGGLRLVQDKFIVGEDIIDQTKYFRHNLFKKYTWKLVKTHPEVEVSKIPFEVKILDRNLGKHELEVRHKPTGEAGQGNYTTSISWGELGEIIKESNLTGFRLDVYAPAEINDSYHIIISKGK